MNKALLQSMTNGELISTMHKPLNVEEHKLVDEEVRARFDHIVHVKHLAKENHNPMRATTPRR